MGTLKSGFFPNPLTIDQKNRHVTKVTEEKNQKTRVVSLKSMFCLGVHIKAFVWTAIIYSSSDFPTWVFYNFWIRDVFPKWNEWLASFSSVPPNIPPQTVFLCLHFITEYIWPFSWSPHKTSNVTFGQIHLSCSTIFPNMPWVAGELVTHCQSYSMKCPPLK